MSLKWKAIVTQEKTGGLKGSGDAYINKESFPLSFTQSRATPDTASSVLLPLKDSSFTLIILGKLQFSVMLLF